MDNLINDFYEGFEGESEVKFIRGLSHGNKTVLRIWDGYFDDIMRQFEPVNSCWVGLAYIYHTCIGWETNEQFEISDLCKTLDEFQNLDTNGLELIKSEEVLYSICKLISDAISLKEKAWIAKE